MVKLALRALLLVAILIGLAAPATAQPAGHTGQPGGVQRVLRQPPPDRGSAAVPELEAQGAGAALALVLGGSLLLARTRRRRTAA